MRVLVAGQPELLEEIARLMLVVAGRKPRLDIGERSLVVAEVRLLRQIADRGARLHEACAAVGLDQASRDSQQCRFAGAVAADQTDPLASRNVELDAVQERRAAKRQLDVLELDQRRRHRQP
ncbi:hypothetical protein BRDID11002_07980 [Bradyrhizobium diazoefficiens]